MEGNMAKDKASSDKSIEDLYLATFKKQNPGCRYSIEDDNFIIEKPWGTEDGRLIYSIADIDSIRDLNNLYLPPKFDAIIHRDNNVAEFLFGYLSPDDEHFKTVLDRKFDFHFDGIKYECSFEQPSERFLSIARAFRRLPSKESEPMVPQIEAFRDAQRLEKLPKRAQEFFSGKVPRNFFIRTSSSFQKVDLNRFARHINFAMNYYDRLAPEIIVRETQAETDGKRHKPLRFIEEVFPSSMSIEALDDFMLQLISVGNKTAARFAFVYFYQVIEYAGFYFLDRKAKRDLRQLLREPSLVACSEDKVTQLFAFLADLSHGDDVKMKHVIEEYCNPKVIWKEIDNDKDFFASPLSFDGGFELAPLISKDITEETWVTMWMPKLYDHLTKIRNCLVHAREKRQSYVILPTKSNNKKIYRYLFLISRIAEQITLNKE
jgi:hypothetical protein